MKLYFHESFLFKNLLIQRFFEVRFSNEVGAMEIQKLSMVEWSGTTFFFQNGSHVHFNFVVQGLSRHESSHQESFTPWIYPTL
jgi:hypothetical protein